LLEKTPRSDTTNLPGVMHPFAWIAIRALVGTNITQIDLDKGLRTAQSPALLTMGLGLVAVGATLAALVFASWSYILSVTKNSVAAAAGGAAAASLLALMGLYGPCAGLREPRSPARCRQFGGVIARAGTRRVCPSDGPGADPAIGWSSAASCRNVDVADGTGRRRDG
jgi:hypothetical protein